MSSSYRVYVWGTTGYELVSELKPFDSITGALEAIDELKLRDDEAGLERLPGRYRVAP